MRLAIHEAGHALVACAVGDEVQAVELGDGSAYLGATCRKTYEGEANYSMAERYILVAVAGYSAERLVCGDNEPSYCDTDMNQAWEAAAGSMALAADDQSEIQRQQELHRERIPVQNTIWPQREEAAALLNRLEAECARLLASRRTDLEALAAHLETHGRCRGADISAICAGTWHFNSDEKALSRENIDDCSRRKSWRSASAQPDIDAQL